jgi:beta-N-acetylhexosaminidase
MSPAIIGLSGPTLTAAETALLQIYHPAGIILFARNIETPAQLAAYIAAIKTASPATKIMLDQEGGRVARLRPPHWPALPAAGTLATEQAAHAHGAALGRLAAQAGIDILTSPVLDLRLPNAHNIVGDRALSANPEIVARLGAALAAGIASHGIIPVMKHIPGHGRATVDSHETLPHVAASDLAADFYPFQANAAGIPWAMTAHVVYDAYDSLPATISKKIIAEIIRGEKNIGFTGTLISDDLDMKALTGTPAERAVAAIAAGCNLALHCSGLLADNESLLQALANVD